MSGTLAWHRIMIGETPIAVRLRNVYSQNGSDIGSIVGLIPFANETAVEATTEVDDLIKNCQAVRMKLRYRSGSGRIRVASIICDVNEAPSARARLVGRNYRGGEILSAWFPRQMFLG